MAEFQTIPVKYVLLVALLATTQHQTTVTAVPIYLVQYTISIMGQTHAIQYVRVDNIFLYLCLSCANSVAQAASLVLSQLRTVLTLTALSIIIISTIAVYQCVHQAIIPIYPRDSA